MSSDPRRPTITGSLGTAFRRIRSDEKRRIWPSEWHCARPVSPAGPWSATQTYYVGDVVSLAGNGYRCIVYHLNHTPPNVVYWEPIADDPLSVAFAGTWENIGAGLEPSAYRFNQGDTDVRLNVTGDEDTEDSLIFTITAAQFIPSETQRVIATMGASGEFQAEVDLMGSQTAQPGQVIFRRLLTPDLTGYIHFSSIGANFGDKLEITTSGVVPFSFGIVLQDHSVLGTRILSDASIEIGSGDGVAISGAGGSVNVNTTDVQIGGNDGVGINGHQGDVIIRTDVDLDSSPDSSIGIFADDGNAYIFGLFGVYIAAHLDVQSSTSYVFPGDPNQFLLSSARDLTVLLHKDNELLEPTTSFIVLSGESAFPRQLFRVDSDNTIHGPVGGAIIWDLL